MILDSSHFHTRETRATPSSETSSHIKIENQYRRINIDESTSQSLEVRGHPPLRGGARESLVITLERATPSSETSSHIKIENQHRRINIEESTSQSLEVRGRPPLRGGARESLVGPRLNRSDDHRSSKIENPPPSPFDIDPTIIIASTVTEIVSEWAPIAICFAEISSPTLLSFGANISVFILSLEQSDAW